MWKRIGKNGNKYWGQKGAGIFFTDGKKVLLLKRNEKGDNFGTWCIPGGKVESGEALIDAATREAKEECGHSKGHRFEDLKEVDGQHVWTTFFFEINKPFSCKLSDEHSDWNWFDINELDKVNLHPKLKENIDRHIKIVKKHFGKLNFKEWLVLRESKWSQAEKITKGELAGHKSIGSGHFLGGRNVTHDFGGEGWKIRLDPKSDKDNYLISNWIKQNLDKIKQYKLAHTEGDHPVWTIYVGEGKLAQQLAKDAENKLGAFVRLDQVFQKQDTVLPGTRISGRFELRGSYDSPRSQSIVKEINKRRKPSQIYDQFKKSPMYMPGFSNSTAGDDGIPGTKYYDWLDGSVNILIKRKSDPRLIKMYQDEKAREIELIKNVIQEMIPEYKI